MEHGRGALRASDVLPAWRALAAHARYPFQTPEWIELVADSLDDLHWGLVLRDGRPVATTALRRRVRHVAQAELDVACELRVGEARLRLVDGLCDPAGAGDVTVAELLDSAFERWHVLLLRQLRSGSPWIELARRGGCHLEPEEDFGAAVLDTTASGPDAWLALPKKMRHGLRKARTLAERHGEIRVEGARGAELAEALDRHIALEAAGWKGRDGTALQAMPVERALVSGFLAAHAGSEVRSLFIADTLAASQIVVTLDRCRFLWKIAYNEGLAELSPGNLLLADLIETAGAAADVDRVDCLTWGPWNERWGMVREPTYTLAAFNRHSAHGRAAETVWRMQRLRERRG